MGDPADISDISDVTGVEKEEFVYGEEFKTMVENTTRELTSPFIAGFFQGWFSVMKQYRKEKKEKEKLAKQQEEQLKQQKAFQDTAEAAELNEGNVWIGVAPQESA